jgi:isopenicillin N synthase-like dioxygenase
MPSDLPVIDLAAADGTDDDARRFRADLRAAAHDVGFFQLVGHGIPAADADRLLALSRAFFALPEAERLGISNMNSAHFRGYTRTGHELTGGVSDWRDQLDVGSERPERGVGPVEPAYWWLEGPNQWPASLPELRPVVLDWMDRLAAVAHRLLQELLMSLGVPRGFYDAAFGPEAHANLKLVRYPGSPTATPEQGVGVHKDYGFLTLLLQDEHPGLQVQTADGGFIPVPPMRGAFVVNLGELLEVATDGLLTATNHRVVSPPAGTTRYSVPFFYNPRLNARVRRLPDEYLVGAPGVTTDPANPIYPVYGENAWKGWLRAHPDVARRHHPAEFRRLGGGDADECVSED